MSLMPIPTDRNLGWRRPADFEFARGTCLQPVSIAEIPRVAQVAPVAFRKQAERWQAVAVLGPLINTNVFVSRVGKWRASFVPALLRVYPFALDDDGAPGVWSEYTPALLAAEGVLPFHEGDALSPLVAQIASFLKAVHLGIADAHPVLARLEKAGLLVPFDPSEQQPPPPSERAPVSMHIGAAQEGLHVLDAARFAALRDGPVIELFRLDALRWLYAHADSLHFTSRFTAAAQGQDMPELDRPSQPDTIENVADLLATIATDLGDVTL